MGFGWQKVGLFFNGKPLILKPGDVCLLDKDRTHEGTKATTCNYYYVHFMHGEMKLVDAREEKVAKQQFERRRKAMAKEPCEPYGSYDESEIWLPKYWHIKKVTDQIHIDELIKQAIAEDYSTFDNHKILCACRIQETLIEIARCFTIAEREKSVGGFPESYYKVQKIQEWLNVSYAAEISEERLEEEFDGNFDYMNCIFKRVTGQTIFQYLTAVRMEPIGEFYSKWKAIECMENGEVVIMSAGTGNPFFTTDTGSSLRGIEIEADVMLKGTRVDGIYTADPEKDPTATKFDDITYDEVLKRGLKVMDLTATCMCKENNLPIVVFDMDTVGNLKKVISGEEIGTLVHN